MARLIQTRRDTAAQWLAVNPVLAVGEASLETDTLFEKYGNGVDTYDLLPYQPRWEEVTKVADIAARLALLGVQKGDTVIQQDISRAYKNTTGVNLVDTDWTVVGITPSVYESASEADMLALSDVARGDVIFRTDTNDLYMNNNLTTVFATGVPEALVITDFTKIAGRDNIFTAVDEAAQIALLEVEQGDVCLRTDLGTTFKNVAGLNAAITDWVEIAMLPGGSSTRTFTVVTQASMFALTNVGQGDICIVTDDDKTYRNLAGLNTVIGDWVVIAQAPSTYSAATEAALLALTGIVKGDVAVQQDIGLTYKNIAGLNAVIGDWLLIAGGGLDADDIYTVADETSMLALAPIKQGDIVIRTDLGLTYKNVSGSNVVMGDWQPIGGEVMGSPLIDGQVYSSLIDGTRSWVSREDPLMKGAVNGYPDLDASGLVPSSQLPAYVDDVITAADLGSFPATGETSKIYMADDTGVIYRWSGATYVEISSSLALGITMATAYRGDHGLIAYNHANLVTGNPHVVLYSQLTDAPVVINNLTTGGTTNVLSAEQGKVLQTTKANLASPTFTGVPRAPTAGVGNNTTQLATTAFVLANSSNVIVSNVLTNTSTVQALSAAMGKNLQDLKAPKASPTFTGTVQAPILKASGLTTLSAGLNVTGAIVATGDVTAFSDERLKADIEVIENALFKVKQLNGVTFRRTDAQDKNERHTGIIAQEVMAVIPEAVQISDTEDKFMSVAYGNLVGLLIQSIKELESRVAQLEEK